MPDRTDVLFVLRMAWRETRAAWLRLVFFFICVSIGVAAIIALRSVIQNVRQVMTREARNLIAADLLVESNRPLTAAQQAALEPAAQARPILARSTLVQTLTMMRPGAGVGLETARLAEIRGVDAVYPLYGTMTLESGRPYSHTLLADHGAIVQPDVLAQLGVKVGDTLIIAGQAFAIRDVLVKETVQRRGGVSFGPRVYVDLDAMRQLPVFGFGSRVNYAWMFKVADERTLTDVEGHLNAVFAKTPVNVVTWKRLEDRIGNALSVGEDYLSLIGFAIVVLGGIGVWSVTRVFIQQKLQTIAVLKCLGASSAQTVWTYVIQITALSLAGCVLGAGIAAAALTAIPASTLEALRLESVHLTVSAVGQGSLVGLLVSLLFAAVPLLEIRQVKPLLLMRADTAPTARRRNWRSVATLAALAAAIALVAVWQAGSLKAGAIVTVGLGAAALVLHLASRLLVLAVRPLARSRRFALRHAVVSIGRVGGQTRVVLMAVGLGAFFVLGMRIVQANLLHEFSPASGNSSPDLVLIDVQQDQVDGINRIAGAHAANPPKFVPMMRGRIVGVTGKHLTLATSREVQDHGAGLAREFGLTYRAALEDNEKVVAGEFWTTPLAEGGPGGELEVSIEQNLQRNNNIALGDVIRFDLAGRDVAARVTSVRRVEWDNVANGGFVFVFRPGAIERVPHAFVTFVTGLADPGRRSGFQRDLASGYPNVSAIDVREILKSVQDILVNVTLAVTVVGAVTLVSGILILIGAVAMTKFQRLYDAAIYRTLGASTWRLASMVTIEYGLVGALAGVMGALGALALSFVVSRELFDIDWSASPGLVAGGIAATAALVAVVGLVSSLDVLFRKPLRTLRTE
ncbi:MAG: FtsX-like permease family protein [Acidobacteria bacterium]|nr:MAG: FtsX-like permease family protein [Acidobacteriota bacterium]